jgi:hypothetical protein
LLGTPKQVKVALTACKFNLCMGVAVWGFVFTFGACSGFFTCVSVLLTMCHVGVMSVSVFDVDGQVINPHLCCVLLVMSLLCTSRARVDL